MSISERLQSLNLAADAVAILTFSEGTDVFHFNETEIDTALEETSVVSEFVSLIANPALKVTSRYCGNVIQHLRDGDFLENYERGSGDFENYLAETISENFYDVELIDYTTEKYDHKRGFTTLTAEVEIPVSNLIEHDPFISGWKVAVETKGVTVCFDA